MYNNENLYPDNDFSQDFLGDFSQEEFHFFEFFYYNNGIPVLIAR